MIFWKLADFGVPQMLTREACFFVAGMLKTAFFVSRNSIYSIFIANVAKILTYAF